MKFKMQYLLDIDLDNAEKLKKKENNEQNFLNY
jgi:hypothetical protein